MKSFIAPVLLALSVSAFAASNSSINDLQYLPDQGTVFGSSNVDYLKYSDTFFDGTEMVSASSEGYALSQTLGYSVMNNLFLSAGFTYTDVTSRSSGFSSTTSSGLGDIVVDGRYRLPGDEKRLDLLAKASISPGDDEVKSNGDSNAYSGGHSLSVGVEYGTKKENYQWAVRGLLTRNFEATEDNKDDDEEYKTDAHNSLGFQGQLLTKLSETCFVRNFVGVDFTEEYEDDEDTTYSGATLWNAGAEFQHLLAKDLYLKAGATALMPANGTSAVLMLYNFGANYQF